jgi:hypothetical protein
MDDELEYEKFKIAVFGDMIQLHIRSDRSPFLKISTKIFGVPLLCFSFPLQYVSTTMYLSMWLTQLRPFNAGPRLAHGPSGQVCNIRVAPSEIGIIVLHRYVGRRTNCLAAASNAVRGP